jgi:hypothetical protein
VYALKQVEGKSAQSSPLKSTHHDYLLFRINRLGLVIDAENRLSLLLCRHALGTTRHDESCFLLMLRQKNDQKSEGDFGCVSM